MPDPNFVAGELLAFHHEPVVFRPRLTHGREPFPGGAHVFRFAQGKFPEAMLRRMPQHERRRLREAAAFFVRQVCAWDGATHYQLLCVAPDAKLSVVREHYQALMGLIHPDRAREGEEPWPADFVQRANQAWAVLSDERSRHAYDGWLATSGRAPHRGNRPEPAVAPELAVAPAVAAGDSPGRSRTRRRVRIRTTLGATSLALAGLLFAYTWWATQVPQDLQTLQTAAPLELTLKWMHEVGSSVRPPSFLGASAVKAASEAAPLAEPPKRPAPSPARPELTAATVPSPILAAPSPRSADATAPGRTAPATDAATRPRPEPAPRAGMGAQRVASVTATTDVAPVLPDLEVLVSRLVAHYEGGDLDRFLGLFDPDSVGVLEAMSLRNDFSSFFRSTGSRRLRVRSVDWSVADGVLRGKGRAIVVAEYTDPARRLERTVDFGIEAVMRAGVPKIARLTLFPHE